MTSGRSKVLAGISDNHEFDVVVIGGGINGIGVFRDLSLQGLKVLLVEKNDFCSGCSAAPSRMIHGGLRYLENGEFSLVRESLRERDILLANAPHMVRPLPTLIPIASLFSGLLNSAAGFFRLSGKPAARGLLPIKIGLELYDWVTRTRRRLPRHRIAGSKTTHDRWPRLTRKARYSATYHDAWISYPERLCIELISDTNQVAPGSFALNYATLQNKSGDYLLRDETTGTELTINTKAIVNAAGAWLDDVSADLLGASDPNMVAGTKGSHLIINNQVLHDALKGHMIYFENSDGRVCIVFPYLGRVLAGSTDIRVERPARVRCEPEETDYILSSLKLIFDDISLDENDIVFSYSGIRPLPKSDANFTGRIPRSHYIERIDGRVPQYCMIGGKWTTFRAFGEQVTDQILAEFGRDRIVSTENLPIGGGSDYPDQQVNLEQKLVAEFNISADRARHLAELYGTRSFDIEKACVADQNDTFISPDSQYTRAEISYLIRNEHVVSVADLVLRRTSLAIRGDLDGDLLDSLTEIVADINLLTEAESQQQKQALLDELITFYGVSAESLASTNCNRSIECI